MHFSSSKWNLAGPSKTGWRSALFANRYDVCTLLFYLAVCSCRKSQVLGADEPGTRTTLQATYNIRNKIYMKHNPHNKIKKKKLSGKLESLSTRTSGCQAQQLIPIRSHTSSRPQVPQSVTFSVGHVSFQVEHHWKCVKQRSSVGP